MQILPHTEYFKATLPDGAILDIPIYTRYLIKTEKDVYTFLHCNDGARSIIYAITNGPRLWGRQVISLTHKLLPHPIELKPEMDDEEICAHLIQRRNYYDLWV